MHPEPCVAAGGIVPAALSADATDLLDAVHFVHPAMPGAALIRLVPQSLGVGVATEMTLAGFQEQSRTIAVGRQRRRPPGFPGWALVNDPKNARYALDVMKDFAQARKRIATKPGHARDAFQVLADKLGRAAPHFLPAFWEEAGRSFLAGGSIAMAAAAFEKARGAERQHGLSVDEDQRAASFLEFAIAGALSVKSLLAWPTELKKSRGPAEAYERLFDLARRRTLGGRAPWGSLAKDLRDFAKAASRDPAVEEANFVRTVLGAVALKRAPIGFWKDVAGSVAEAARDPAVRKGLAKLFPVLSSESDITTWVGLLERWGVLAALVSEGVEGGLAAWMGKALDGWDESPAACLTLVNRLAPRLVVEGVPVPVMGDEMWRVTAVDAYEALVAAGVPLKVLTEGKMFALDTWAETEGAHPDLVHLAADPLMAPILRASVRANLDEEAFQALAPGMSAFREARREHLIETVAAFAKGGLLDFDDALGELERKLPASTLAEFPDESQGLATVDVVSALARTLRGGVMDELGWPAYDEAVIELSGAQAGKQPEPVVVHSLAPYAVVSDGRRVRVLGPTGREAAFDLKLPKGAEAGELRWSAGQLLVVWRDTKDYTVRKGYWSGRPKDEFIVAWEGHGAEVTPPRDGGVLSGRRLLRPGDTSVDDSVSFSDAEGAWVEVDGKLHAVDPATGKTGPRDAPAMLTERDGVSPTLSASTYHPSFGPGSPLMLPGRGGEMSTYGWAVFDLDDHADLDGWLARHAPRAIRVGLIDRPGETRTVRVAISGDGRAVLGPDDPRALLTWPGIERCNVLVTEGWRDLALLSSDGTRLATLGEDHFTSGTPVALPLPLWHHLRPRDPVGSGALRIVDDDVAGRLLGLTVDVESEDALGTLAARVHEVLPITHPALARGIAGVVLHAQELHARLEATHADTQAHVSFEGPDDATVCAALSGICSSWYDRKLSVCAAIAGISAFLDGDLPNEPGATPAESEIGWRDWLPSPLALGFVHHSPATSPAEREVIATVLRTLAASRFARPGAVRHVKVRVPKTAAWLKWEDDYGTRVLVPRFVHVDGACRAVCYAGEDDNEDETRTDVELELLLASATPGAPGDLPGGAILQEEKPVAVDGDAILRILGAEPASFATTPADAVYETISERTGLGRVEAACVWAGLRQLDRWGNDPLGKPARDLFGLKIPEVKHARETLFGTAIPQRLRAFHAAMVGWDPADETSLPARLGDAWAAAFGKRAKVDEALVARARLDFPGGDGPAALVGLAGVGSEACYQADGAWLMDADGDVVRGGDKGAAVFDPSHLTTGLGALLWVYSNTPRGDVLRANIPALYTALRARTANPLLLLEVSSGDSKAQVGWFKRFDGLAFTPPGADPDLDEKDRPTGKSREGLYAVFAGGMHDDSSLKVAVRPCELTPGSTEEVERLAALKDNYADQDAWRAFKLLHTPGIVAIVAGIVEEIAVNGAGWGQDPRTTSRGLVNEVAARLDLHEDAATLYLQLLTLYNPTRANVLLWNGWKPSVYARATATLVEKKLVVEAKRARAGRDHFLPGGWHDRKSGSLPLEEWKLAFYGGAEPPLGSIVPLSPFADLFRIAWARVLAGHSPRYEKVR